MCVCVGIYVHFASLGFPKSLISSHIMTFLATRKMLPVMVPVNQDYSGFN